MAGQGGPLSPNRTSLQVNRCLLRLCGCVRFAYGVQKWAHWVLQSAWDVGLSLAVHPGGVGWTGSYLFRVVTARCPS